MEEPELESFSRSMAVRASESILRRNDLAATAAAARSALRAHANPRRGRFAVAAALLALAASVLVGYGSAAVGLPEWISLLGVWGIVAAFATAFVGGMRRKMKRIVQQYQLTCPNCGHDMLTVADLSGQVSAIDLTVESGRCIHCGEVSFAA